MKDEVVAVETMPVRAVERIRTSIEAPQ